MMGKLPMARELLEKFDTLNSLFYSFAGYENKKYRHAKNIVFLMCLPFVGELNLRYEKDLKELDDALRIFNVLNSQDDKMSHLKSRLCSDYFYESLSAFTELVTAKRLACNFGENNVELYPQLSTGRSSDILVKLGAKNVYLEIGILSESLPEKKIQYILDETVRYLASKLPDSNYYLEIDVDTSELVFDQNGHIDEKASVSKLISEKDFA